MQCPCGSEKNFAECCKPLIEGQGIAKTPELLMRSRYSAFATKHWDYLVATIDPQRRVEFANAANKAWMEGVQFTQLEILSSSDEGNKGYVEFKAHFLENEKSEVHHEKAKFRKLSGIWYYRP